MLSDATTRLLRRAIGKRTADALAGDVASGGDSLWQSAAGVLEPAGAEENVRVSGDYPYLALNGETGAGLAIKAGDLDWNFYTEATTERLSLWLNDHDAFRFRADGGFELTEADAAIYLGGDVSLSRPEDSKLTVRGALVDGGSGYSFSVFEVASPDNADAKAGIYADFSGASMYAFVDDPSYPLFGGRQAGDAHDRWRAEGSGAMLLGDGTSPADVRVFRRVAAGKTQLVVDAAGTEVVVAAEA